MLVVVNPYFDAHVPDPNVWFQTSFTGNDPSDISSYAASHVVDAGVVIAGEQATIPGASPAEFIRYNGTGMDSHIGGGSYTLEARLEFAASRGGSIRFIGFVAGSGGANRYVALLATDGSIQMENSPSPKYNSPAGAIPGGSRIHFCWMYRGSDDGTPHLWLFTDGVLVGDFAPLANDFSLAEGLFELNLGSNHSGDGDYIVDEARVSAGLIYSTSGFTPPSDPLPGP